MGEPDGDGYRTDARMLDGLGVANNLVRKEAATW